MSPSVCSAEPAKLFRYADSATRIDQELVAESQQLAGALQSFDSGCTEYHMSTSHLPGALRGYAGSAEGNDAWVHRVGLAFQIADAAPWLTPFIPGILSVLVGGVSLLPGDLIWPGIPWPARIVIRPPRVILPPWLRWPKLGPWLRPAPTSPLTPAAKGQPLPTTPPAQPSPDLTEVTRRQREERVKKILAEIDQLDVDHNFLQKGDDTYCNIFAMTLAKKMGAELPEFVKRRSKEEPIEYLDANKMVAWLRGTFVNRDGDKMGPAPGWQTIDAAKAAAMAQAGYVVIAGRESPGGIGHMAVVRPESSGADDIRIAQAGRNNFSNGTLEQGFGSNGGIEFFVYVPPSATDSQV